MDRSILSLTPLGAFLALGLVGSAFVIGRAVVKAVPSNQIVKVRGVAEQSIDSDRVRWRITVRGEAKQLEDAYTRVDTGVERVRAFLTNGGVPAPSVRLGSYRTREISRRVVLDQLGNDEWRFVAHEVRRTVELDDFRDLDLVEKLVVQFGDVVQRAGVPADADEPYFFYSEPVADIKPDLLRAAAENAYQRARIVADSSHSTLGPLRAARQGAFEGFGDAGYVGGASRKHRVTALVTVDFAIE